MMTPAALKDIASYATGLGPWKNTMAVKNAKTGARQSEGQLAQSLCP